MQLGQQLETVIGVHSLEGDTFEYMERIKQVAKQMELRDSIVMVFAQQNDPEILRMMPDGVQETMIRHSPV